MQLLWEWLLCSRRSCSAEVPGVFHFGGFRWLGGHSHGCPNPTCQAVLQHMHDLCICAYRTLHLELPSSAHPGSCHSPYPYPVSLFPCPRVGRTTSCSSALWTHPTCTRAVCAWCTPLWGQPRCVLVTFECSKHSSCCFDELLSSWAALLSCMPRVQPFACNAWGTSTTTSSSVH